MSYVNGLLVVSVMILVISSDITNIKCQIIDDMDNSIERTSSEQQQQQQQPQVHQKQQQTTSSQRSRLDQDWIKFTKIPPVKVIQTFGTPVEILCEVMGSQVPTIHWFIGQSPMAELENLEANSISETSSNAIVRVRSIHIVDHMLTEPRTYTCVGRTGSKTLYASTTVYPQTDLKDLIQLRDKQFSGPRKPKIIYSEKLHLDLVGSNILLPCKVYSRPHAEVYWMNNDGKLIEQNHRFKLLSSGDLLVTDVKWEDMGAYKCIARNAIGKDTADTFVYPVLKENK